MDPLWIKVPQYHFTISTLRVALLWQGWSNRWANSRFEMCSHSLISMSSSLIFICSHFLFYIYPSLSLSLSLCSLLLRVEGTSEGSGWLSLLEADGRPKARRPQFHEAWFEHARTMSRGMPVDDGYIVCVSVCMYVSEHLGEDGWFCRLPIWEMRPSNHSLSPQVFFFFRYHLCISMYWWGNIWKTIAIVTFQWFGGSEVPYCWCPAAL